MIKIETLVCLSVFALLLGCDATKNAQVAESSKKRAEQLQKEILEKEGKKADEDGQSNVTESLKPNDDVSKASNNSEQSGNDKKPEGDAVSHIESKSKVSGDSVPRSKSDGVNPIDLSPPGSVPGEAKSQNEMALDSNDVGKTETGLANIPVPEESDEQEKEIHTIEFPKSWKRLSETEEIWLDKENEQVIAGGRICLDRGGLEMFICPERTKEHESVIAIRAQAFQIHASLLALGVKPGKPVDWGPPYVMATGPKIKITVIWVDAEKQPEPPKDGEFDFAPMVQPEKIYPVSAPEVKRLDGREFVRNIETRKTLEVDWVFGGSLTEKGPNGQNYYYGDGGELVCVSNFATATMDLPIRSSQAGGSLMFEVNSAKVPRRNTKVYVVFEKKKEAADKPQEP